jgi:hypothetical protein
MISQSSKKSNPARQHKRLFYPPELVVTCEGATRNIPLSGPDISTHGMFINTTAPLSEGTVLKLAFRLTRSAIKIFVRGEVRYCIPGVGVGVEFIDLSQEANDAIEQEISDNGH